MARACKAIVELDGFAATALLIDEGRFNVAIGGNRADNLRFEIIGNVIGLKGIVSIIKGKAIETHRDIEVEALANKTDVDAIGRIRG